MNFIKKLWQGLADESVHKNFIRFGKGKYERRAAIAMRSNGSVRLSSTFEYANDLVLFFVELSDRFKAEGKILAREKINFAEIGINATDATANKKKGLFEAEIKQELSREQLKKLADKVYFMLIDLSFSGGELKIKKKLAKPGKAAGKIDDKFCTATLSKNYLQKVKDEFFFDVKQPFKQGKAEHTLEIREILLPKNISNFEQARIDAKRKGKIIRKLEIDGSEQTFEKEFIA